MPLVAVTPRPYRVVGIGALVVQLPPPGETSKLGARRVAWRVGSVDCSQLTMRAAPANSAAVPGKRSKEFIIHLAPLDHDRGKVGPIWQPPHTSIAKCLPRDSFANEKPCRGEVLDLPSILVAPTPLRGRWSHWWACGGSSRSFAGSSAGSG